MSKKSVIRRVETQVGIAVGVISLSVMGVFLGIKKGEQKHEEPVSLTRVEEDTSDILDLSAIEKAPTAASLAAPTTETPSVPGVKPSEQTREELMATADSVDEEKPVAEAPATSGVAAQEKVEGEATASTTKASPSTTTHTITANDTLMSLARQYYGDETKWGLIYKANNLPHQDKLVVGQKLVIPDAGKVTGEKKAAKVASPKKRDATPGMAHRVQVGDTLDKLAMEYYNDASKWEKIFKANQISLANRKSLKPGEVLIIP